ncbi:2-dehydropantoate 2-reductase [Pyrolobus fumarii 1A]|uniref:2-dehydropantoate 2-reductase n=1 Tax=Pyrolobus fumarii (strain DSM 11204 / 1A) TaxID=694429 RepID=G0EGS6_PYRF1|nr:2-dehydropantoate 2-reductase [Pyrolobus fumarii]AEM39224.1 2-dehydropantoate 2-reductase [Pyrolobus fumarii 1A]
MSARQPRVCIIGCGAMGLFYAAKLASAGVDVALLCRRLEQAQVINSEGVIVEVEGGFENARVKAYLAVSPPRSQFDIGIVAVKAYDTPAAIDLLEVTLRRNGVAVSVQNGLGPLEALENSLGAERAAAAVTYYGVTRLGDNRVRFEGGAAVYIGQREKLHDRVEHLLGWLVDKLREANLNAYLVDRSIEPWRWDKLIVNAAINPVTAITGAPNYIVLHSEWAQRLAYGLAEEAATVARAHGIPLPREPRKAVEDTARATAYNRSSMLQDIEAGRRTEIDFINGAVVAKGREKGVETPLNEAMVYAVKALEDAVASR